MKILASAKGLAKARDSTVGPGSCRKPPGALYAGSGRERELSIRPCANDGAQFARVPP